MAMEECDAYKLVLLGKANVGKSSLVIRFVTGKFMDHMESTIGASFFTKTFKVDDEDVTFEIWDTAGQERYHSLAPMYYRGARAAIVVYDVTDVSSYFRAHKWIEEVKNSSLASPPVIALVGNKIDMVGEKEIQVGTDEAKEWAQSHGILFVETSAKTGVGVQETFEKLWRNMPHDLETDVATPKTDISRPAEGSNKKKGCCEK